MIIGAGERNDEGRHRLGQRTLILRRIDMKDLRDALQLRCMGSSAIGLVAGDKHMHIAAELCSGAQRLVGRVLEMSIVMLGNEKNGHLRSLPLLLSFDDEFGAPISP